MKAIEHYQLIPRSSNSKTGPIAVSTSSSYTCPASCPFSPKIIKDENGVKKTINRGCYAHESFHTSLNFKKVSSGQRGGNWEYFLEQVSELDNGVIYRHGVSGDLPGKGENIDEIKLDQLATILNKKKAIAFGYSHKKPKGKNLKAIRAAIAKNFVINISCETFDQVDKMKALGLPTVIVLPSDSPYRLETKKGNRIVVCPAQQKDNGKDTRKNGKPVTCKTCQLCSKNRGITVGFLAHSTGTKRVDEILNNLK